MIVENSQPPAERIILHHTPSCWIAEFRGAVGLEMAAIAGADTLPTGFNGHIPAAVVCRAIALLNPEAEVSLAEAAGTEPRPMVATGAPARALLRALEQPQPKAAVAEPEPAPCDPALRLAAQVIAKHVGAAPAPAKPSAQDRERRATLERAIKIKKGLGLMVACSYLKERGWSFEAAHQALLETAPRKVESGRTP
jgi:hypothetical protein